MSNDVLKVKKLYPGKIKSLLLFVVNLLFVAMGIFLINKGERFGWAICIFFGLGTIVSIINLLPQASYLKLDEEGFETCSMFRKNKYNWKDVVGFGVGRISTNKMVVFNFSKEFKGSRKIRKVSSSMTGFEGALHDTFGWKAEELAELMNTYKRESAQKNS